MVQRATVAQAAAFLNRNLIPHDQVSPEQFLAASEELGVSFSTLLRRIGRMLNSGQGMGQAPIARGIAEESALAASRGVKL